MIIFCPSYVCVLHMLQETQQKFIERVQEYIELVSPNVDDPIIEEIISSVTQMLGFDRYSFMSGTVFGGRSITGWDNKRPHRFINLEKAFVEEYSINRLDKHDLVLIKGMNAWEPFRWSNVYKTHEVDKRKVKLKELSSDFGMREGVLFPTQGFNDDISLFSLSCGKESHAHDIPILMQSLILMLINKIHFSIKAKHLKQSPITDKKLSPRELDVLLWLKEGKTYWEIGKILNISEHTVETHLRRARAKLNVATKEQAIAKTLTIRMMAPI